LGGRVEIVTFGCRLNSHESEILRKVLEESIKMGVFGGRDVVVFNSCAVTSEAERQLRQSIRKIRREKGKDILVGVVGCAVQTDSGAYLKMPEVDFIVGNSGKLKVESYLTLEKGVISAPDTPSSGHLVIQQVYEFGNRRRGSVKIQDGCDNKCTFCITRFARGRSISAMPTDVLEHVKKLVDLGYREIVLTGVNICDYGNGLNLDVNLGKLVGMLIRKTSLERLRLSSLDPAALDPDLNEQLKYEKRLMPHLHLSLQSGNDTILRRMGRRHNRNDVFRLCKNILDTRPEVIFGADLIAGFPTETENMHKDSISIVEELPITYGHIFPYSSRPGTGAASMPQISRDIKKERARQLRKVATANLLRLRKSLVNTEQKVFVETSSLGRLENYLQVSLEGDYSGDIGNIVVTHIYR
jgi:threonylcarbamoyladenosine tRNA methylthiotransferase MtaB